MLTLRHYMSLVRFSHTVFAMPFALIGFFLGAHDATHAHHAMLLIKVLLCMVTARNAAMGFNRWLDRDIDAANPRTITREIPAGIISADRALWFVILNAVSFVAVTAFINPLCLWLSPVALGVVLGYSYTKRFTALCHLVLGTGLALAPIGAYVAVTGQFAMHIVLLGAAVMCWVSGFDIIYALQDDEFDRGHRLHSIPAHFGRGRALIISRMLHIICIALLAVIGYEMTVGWPYWSGLTVFAGLIVYQHSIVRADDLSRVTLAFGTTNGVASVVFAVFVLADLFMRW
jgi:4-hydroxybenzoate polyprenyltransferase